MNDGGHAGITDQDLRKAGGGGISDECRTKVADEHPAGFLAGSTQLFGSIRILQRLNGRRPIGHKQTAPVHLLKKAVKRDIQDVADEVIDILGIEIGSTIVPRKHRFDEDRPGWFPALLAMAPDGPDRPAGYCEGRRATSAAQRRCDRDATATPH